MAEVYYYSKSSCDCFDCEKKDYLCDKKGVPTNMSIRNCELSSMYNCYNNQVFKCGLEPNENKGYDILNSKVFDNKYATDFQQISCSGKQSCPKIQYASPDPRLISVAHGGQVLTLDRPPYESETKLENISSDKKLNNYGQNYSSYSDISGGDIVYYTNKSLEDAFYYPNFSTSTNTTGYLYRDPMGGLKPQYIRNPLVCNIEPRKKGGCLSWIEDSGEHREDLISLQMLKRNQERWSPRWSSLKSC